MLTSVVSKILVSYDVWGLVSYYILWSIDEDELPQFYN